jgi:hypothetical protein
MRWSDNVRAKSRERNWFAFNDSVDEVMDAGWIICLN